MNELEMNNAPILEEDTAEVAVNEAPERVEEAPVEEVIVEEGAPVADEADFAE